MKQNESEYLEKLFAATSDISNEAEVDFPMLEVSEDLSDRLHAIAENKELRSTKPRSLFARLPKLTAIAATLVVAVVGFQFYQQQQTIQQLEQAQADLATALHYLGEANRIARSQVRDSINDSIKKAAVDQMLDIEPPSSNDGADASNDQEPSINPAEQIQL